MGKAFDPADRRHLNDVTGALGPQDWQYGLGNPQGAEKVGLRHLFLRPTISPYRLRWLSALDVIIGNGSFRPL